MTSVNNKPKTPALTFPATELRHRHDGWTAERQVAFIEALAETACVEEAARRVGMSVQSAYRLRKHMRAAHFREAWDSALDMAMHRLEQAALGRALNGVARPVFYKGEQVGEWRHHDERLTMFLLRYRRPARFGVWLDHVTPPPLPHPPGWEHDPAEDDSAGRLDWHCGEIGEAHWVEGDDDTGRLLGPEADQ